MSVTWNLGVYDDLLDKIFSDHFLGCCNSECYKQTKRTLVDSNLNEKKMSKRKIY